MLDLFGSALASERKQLRSHQVRAIEMVRQSLGSGNRRVVIQMPTGAGKTLTATRIIEGALAKGNDVIFTAPMIPLIDQTVTAFEAEGIRDIGVMQASHPRANRFARVQVASIQTLARREVPKAALVIVDEAHIRAEVIDKLMDERPDVFFIGLSATPWRAGMGLRWQDLVIPCTIGDLIRDGLLSQFVAYGPDVPDLSRVKTVRGDYAEAQLAEVMGESQLVGSVVATWLERGEGRPTLVFGVNRAHAKQIAEQFARAGIATAYVDGETDGVERALVSRQFRAGEVRIICSVRTMTTGVDLPVSCIVDAAPTKSQMLHVQKIGRGLRVNPGTEDCIILDHAGNSLRLGLVTDIHHSRLSMAKPGAKDEREREKPAEALPKPCTKCEVLFAGRECPACGHERRPPCTITHVDGGLVQISGKAPKVSMEQKERRYAGLLWIAQQRGYKPGWAYHKYAEWHGVHPPSGMKPAPEAPSLEVTGWVKSRQIAYAKSARA